MTTWADLHPVYICGCLPNAVKVKGRYNEKQRRWFYYATCKRCGEYGSSVSASLFHNIIKRADDHARHGFTRGWTRP